MKDMVHIPTIGNYYPRKGYVQINSEAATRLGLIEPGSNPIAVREWRTLQRRCVALCIAYGKKSVKVHGLNGCEVDVCEADLTLTDSLRKTTKGR